MKNLLEIEIGEVWVEGEVSNLRRQASGHCYFTLKDEGAQVSCVLFRGHAARAKTQPENGMQVRVFGEVSVYEARGQMQLIVKQVEDAGLGDLQARFEALKRKLDAEGLFDPSIKKALPEFPVAVGLITSPTSAALQDMLNILSRRAPWVQPVLYPVQVQGAGAEHGIARALEQWGEPEKHGLPEVDVLIVGRGGGSLEDLWNFNEEVVARAIYACPVPVVSAVGHEIDFSIADFVADMRAPTPSAAAELVVPDAVDLRARVERLSQGLKRVVDARLKHDEMIVRSAKRALMPRDAERALREPIMELDRMRQELASAAGLEMQSMSGRVKELTLLHAAHHPEKVMQRRSERLDHAKVLFEMAGKSGVQQMEQRLRRLSSLVKTLGPDATFARGFSITMDAEGNVIRKVEDVEAGDVLQTRLAQGSVLSEVQRR
ncbi:exodeoxyribonuclease VII large subunit [Verrucomicrobiaceae bacterium N1E253]|uniref:Exodeoxyribonuclease 7 large subunit n=2 Tax=Oceaniferula marina TaxID=2748318 RepID=A0A851GP74_9BACT|nr:exodeoxyribonuclease VII large subunit [Oceaniferula marina]